MTKVLEWSWHGTKKHIWSRVIKETKTKHRINWQIVEMANEGRNVKTKAKEMIEVRLRHD